MSNLREAATLALEALELEATDPPLPETAAAMDALRAALAGPMQPLTQEEIDALFNRLCHERSAWPDRRYRDFARWVERAHGIGDSDE